MDALTAPASVTREDGVVTVRLLPPSLADDVQRILDAEARRLLAARLDGHAADATAGSDVGSLDDRTDEGPSRIH